MLTPKLSTNPNLFQTGSDSVKLRTAHTHSLKNIDLNFISIQKQCESEQNQQ